MSSPHKIFKNILIILYLLFFIRNLNYGLLSFVSICIHESAHILIIKAKDISHFGFSILGFKIDINDMFNIKHENFIYISGSLLNILVGLTSLILMKFLNFYFLYEFMIINFIIGFVNIIPVFPLDGAILFKNLLFTRFNCLKSAFISIFVSFFLTVIWFGFSIYYMFKFSFINFSCILIIVFIFISTYKEYKIFRSAFLITSLENIKYTFKNKKYMNTNVISLDYSINLLDVIKLFSFKKFSVFYFFDDSLEIIGVMSEFDIIKKYREFGNVQVKFFYKNN